MKNVYRFDKAFGPAGTYAGVVLFIAGLAMLYSSWTGSILVLLRAFTGFTHTATTIDFKNKKVRFSNNLFGIIPTGKWVILQNDMKLTIQKYGKGYRTYSRSNRVLDIQKKELRIVLLNSNDTSLIPLKSISEPKNKIRELKKMGEKLELRTVMQ